MPAKPDIVLVHGAWAGRSLAACDGEGSTVDSALWQPLNHRVRVVRVIVGARCSTSIPF